jgi:hypothetical protein
LARVLATLEGEIHVGERQRGEVAGKVGGGPG